MEHQEAPVALNLEVLVGVEEEVRPFQEEEVVVVVLQDPLVEVVVEEAFLLAACREVVVWGLPLEGNLIILLDIAILISFPRYKRQSNNAGQYHYHGNINCTDAGAATGANDPDTCKLIGKHTLT